MTEHEVQGIPVSELARTYGTPLYVYDADVLRRQYERLRDALHPAVDIFYSLKSNPNIAVFSLLRSWGAGAEVSSLAELTTARRAGVAPDDVIFLGPGKSRAELVACVDDRVYATICESFSELENLNELAGARGVVAPVAVRVNPRFEVTGGGLTMGGKPRQFGIDEEQLDAPGLPQRFPWLRFIGVHAYVGTRILNEQVVVDNTARILELAERIAVTAGFPLEFVDVGGGLGVAYFDNERDLDIAVLTDGLNPIVAEFAARHPATRLVMELGRYLSADAGLFVVGVRYVKTSRGERFAIADGGTNHHMAAVGIGSFVKRNFPMALLNRIDEPASESWTVTGPLCTPGDTLGRKVALPPVRPGDLLGVFRSGAYGPSASPVLFLSHGHPAEVIVHERRHHLVRERDQVADLLGRQRLPTFTSQEVSTP